MTEILWLTNIETAEPVGVPLSKLLLIEQKRAEDGGAVALYLDHGREVHVSESLSRVNELIGVVAAEGTGHLSGGSRQTPARLAMTGAETGAASGPMSLATSA